MKKKLIFGVATATLLSASAVLAGGPEIIPQPDYFSGFFVGGTVSVHNLVTNQDSTFVSPTAIIGGPFSFVNDPAFQPPIVTTTINYVLPAGQLAANETDGGTIDIYGGVQGGFGMVFAHQFYLGVMGFGEWGKQQATTSNETIAINQFNVNVSSDAAVTPVSTSNTASTIDIFNSTTTQIKADYGVAAKLGYLFTPTTMLYGKIGAEWANIKVSTSVAGEGIASSVAVDNSVTDVTVTTTTAADLLFTGSSSSSDTKVGLLLGIGLEQFVYADIVSLGLEYDYANFGSVSTTGDVLVTNGSGATTGTAVTNNDGTITSTSSTPAAVNQTLTNALTASANAKISTFLASLNFYFGRDWI